MTTRDDDFDTAYDDDEEVEVIEEEEEEAPRRNPLRTIILLLAVLVLLCIGCTALARTGLLPIGIPGVSPSPEEPVLAVDTPLPEGELTPTLETPGEEATAEAALPGEGEAPVEGEQPAEGELPAEGEQSVDGELPAEGEQPAEDELPADGEQPADGEPPAEGELPAEGEQPVDGEPPAEGEQPDEGELPADGEQPVDGEPPAEGEQPAEDEPSVEGEPPAEGELPAEGGDEGMDSEHAEEEVMPGAAETPTPAPGETAPAASCDTNTAPTADAAGPYTAMMGKGEAFVIFDASGSTDTDGVIETYEWDFGDGNSSTETEASVTYGYGEAGSYTATLTVTDNCGATDEVTVDVTIAGPTPPADPSNGSGDNSSGEQGSTAPTATPAPAIAGTQGFCYRVQRGDTLYGIAGRFGVFWPDLARVNNVDPGYYVIAGQGLFVPTGEISQPPNLYEVQAGDTLNSIAVQCGLSVMALSQANGLGADDTPSPGDMMVIPPWRY